jgi:glutaredoxin
MTVIGTGKCPHCKNALRTVRLENVEVVVSPLTGQGGPYVGVSYVCPHCDSVLSVQIDPVALKTDTVAETVKRLRQG